jgi:hypothetical protein
MRPDRAQQSAPPYVPVATGDVPDPGHVIVKLDRTRTDLTSGHGAPRLPERLQVAVRDYQGRRYVDARIWFQRDGAWLPGKTGITFKPHELAEIQQALSQAARFIEGTK